MTGLTFWYKIDNEANMPQEYCTTRAKQLENLEEDVVKSLAQNIIRDRGMFEDSEWRVFFYAQADEASPCLYEVAVSVRLNPEYHTCVLYSAFDTE